MTPLSTTAITIFITRAKTITIIRTCMVAMEVQTSTFTCVTSGTVPAIITIHIVRGIVSILMTQLDTTVVIVMDIQSVLMAGQAPVHIAKQVILQSGECATL